MSEIQPDIQPDIQSDRPIGIFDSGVGGLTVYREICRCLPQENVIYLGDTARVPYGTKSTETVVRYALQDSLFLLDQGVKLIVVACNTATACALPYLQDRLRVPVMGVIAAGARAALRDGAQRVGIIATDGTIRSGAYEKALRQLNPTVECFAQATPLLVPLIEESIADSKVILPVLEYYLSGLREKNLDALILGCTHYPILFPALSTYMGAGVRLVDSASTTAANVVELLQRGNLLRGSNHLPVQRKIYVTDAPGRVSEIAGRILGTDAIDIQRVEL